MLISQFVLAQEFDKNVSTARSAYASGNLQDSRFAMEQMLRDLDMAIGKEVLKLLPVKVGALAVNEKEDNVTGSGAYVGLYVNRHYGTDPKRASIEIINNSPLITSLNAVLNMPVIGGMMRDENQKIIRVQGYKSILNKQVNTDTGKTNYELQIPMNNTLLTLKMDDTTESEITSAANAIPLAKIVQIAQ
ncbi:MAG: hypothetical protein E6Q41_02215 [Cyclobacteriaceae bacterium]|nr:MAG: hypothetical protein E6Q41_02215 [Cyclobacteriaceae bacterium]